MPPCFKSGGTFAPPCPSPLLRRHCFALPRNVPAKKKTGSMCRHYCYPGKSCSNKFCEVDDAEVVELSKGNDEDDTKNGEHIWTNVGQTVLTQGYKIAVASGQWLNDKHLYAAQQLLQKQQAHIGGLEDTMLQPMVFLWYRGVRNSCSASTLNPNTGSRYPPLVVLLQ